MYPYLTFSYLPLTKSTTCVNVNIDISNIKPIFKQWVLIVSNDFHIDFDLHAKSIANNTLYYLFLPDLSFNCDEYIFNIKQYIFNIINYEIVKPVDGVYSVFDFSEKYSSSNITGGPNGPGGSNGPGGYNIPGDLNIFEEKNEPEGSNVPSGSNVPDNGIRSGSINPRSYTWLELGTDLRLNDQDKDPNINRWVRATKEWLRNDLLPYVNNFRISLFQKYNFPENSYTCNKFINPEINRLYRVTGIHRGFMYRAGQESFNDLITLSNNVISNPYMVHRTKEIESFFLRRDISYRVYFELNHFFVYQFNHQGIPSFVQRVWVLDPFHNIIIFDSPSKFFNFVKSITKLNTIIPLIDVDHDKTSDIYKRILYNHKFWSGYHGTYEELKKSTIIKLVIDMSTGFPRR